MTKAIRLALISAVLAAAAMFTVAAPAAPAPTCYCTNGVRFAAQGTCYFCQDIKYTVASDGKITPRFTDNAGVTRELTWRQIGFANQSEWAKAMPSEK
jgi:hypothetical protein